VVNVSSGAQEPLDFDDPMLEEDYSGSRSYARSKLAQVLFTFELARRTEDDLVVNALHPATYMDTRMVRELEVEPRSTVSEGAEAVMRLVLDEDVGTGGYFDGSRPARAHDQAYDPEARERLWEVSEELVRR
jgi:NAD(P)-dependent dehydrogenase (short-subunit alcohol dehydrogenase family)